MLDRLVVFVLGVMVTAPALAQEWDYPQPPPPVPVSEPNMILLLGAGVLAVILARRLYKK